jgi:hypothetical protein
MIIEISLGTLLLGRYTGEESMGCKEIPLSLWERG